MNYIETLNGKYRNKMKWNSRRKENKVLSNNQKKLEFTQAFFIPLIMNNKTYIQMFIHLLRNI